MTDPRRVHDAEQRTAAAVEFAGEVAAFYRHLRAQKVPPVAAQGLTETYLEGRMMGHDEREDWR